MKPLGACLSCEVSSGGDGGELHPMGSAGSSGPGGWELLRPGCDHLGGFLQGLEPACVAFPPRLGSTVLISLTLTMGGQGHGRVVRGLSV